MKSYTVLATFPMLPAKAAQQAATTEASKPSVAVSRALDSIFERPAVKGRRIDHFKLSVTCNGEVEKS
jgi:hypothetical protein